MDQTLPADVREHPPRAADRLNAEMDRLRFIEAAQAYLGDLYQWLRENNHHLRDHKALTRFTVAHDELLALAFDQAARDWAGKPGRTVPRVALTAVGGYGRGEIFLRSDVDLLLLMEQNSREHEGFVKALMHLLIDMRLNLGYATRTIGDCGGVFGRDLESSTTMVESRLLAGDRTLFDAYTVMVQENIGNRWRKWFLKSIYEQWLERHAKYEKTVYLLEPNVKEGAGGLRDTHTVIWVLFALTGSTDLDRLREAAGFTEGDLQLYRAAIEMIQTVRNEIHIASGAKSDQLLFSCQTAVAQRLGYTAQEHRTPEEVFMGDYYRHARILARYSSRAIRVMLRQEKSVLGELFGSLRRKRLDDWLYMQDDAIHVERDKAGRLEEDHRLIMTLFERASRMGCALGEETLDYLSHISGALGPAFRLDPDNQRRFLNILRQARSAATTLADMHECGILDKFLPEFAHINCMVRIDYYHHYTVDEHTIKALEMAEHLLREPVNKRSFAGQIAAEVRRWDLLNLALLLHDVGKGYGRGHALRGGQVAQRIGDRLKLSPTDVDTVRWLVLSHLKLSHAAQRRDLTDPQVARQLAEEIGTLERLKLLYVHSVCDLMAVSPDAWNEWKEKLLAECYMRTAEVLGESHAHTRQLEPNLAVLRQRITTAIREENNGALPTGLNETNLAQELDTFLTHTSDRYIQTSAPDTIARHFLMRRTLDERNVIGWWLQPDTGAGFSELTVCATDVPGLFNFICGALAAKDINIWSAQIFSTTDGLALNKFQVTDPENKPLPAGLRLDRLHQDLNQVILGDKTIEALMEKHRGRSRKQKRVPSPLPSTVLFDNESSQQYTIIEIRTADRPGLLYQITGALNECMLNIQRSIITTEAYGVVDVFYVTDLEYNKIYDPIQRHKIEETILASIAS